MAVPAFARSNYSPDRLNDYLLYLKGNEMSPKEYIISSFVDKDIVIVGEVHLKKEYCELISEVIRSAKINYFASEFIKSSDTDKVNEIVSAEAFDREKAIDILRDYTWPTWGFEEYLDIIESVWQANSAIRDPKKKIKIIGLDSEWSQYENMCGDKKSQKVLFRQNLEREKNMVRAVREKYVGGTKILVQTGFAHSLYKFKSRFAAELYDGYKDKVFQICLHQVLDGVPSEMTISGDIEKIMAANGDTPAGFDIAGSPFAGLNDPACFYFKVRQHKDLADIAMFSTARKKRSAKGSMNPRGL